MSKVLVINPILYTAETDRIPKVDSIKDTMIYTMCMGFLRAGHEVTLIAAQDYRPVLEETYDFPILWFHTAFRRLFLPRCFPYMPKLRRYLKTHPEYDMIVTSEVFATWSYTAARIAPEKTVIWHELAAYNRMLRQIPAKFWYRFVARFLMRRVRVVPRSAEAGGFIRQFMPLVEAEPIDHGVDPKRFCPIESKAREDCFAVVSQLIPRKCIAHTITVFADFVRAGHESCRLRIIGAGEEEEMLRELVKRLAVEERVVFHGKLSHEELLPLVAASKALLVSTKKDNNMVSIVESIALGTPVVTTSVPYNASYIRREELGIVEDDWQADALERIVRENDRYVTNCLAYRERLFNTACAERFLALMK
ncbi:MAG: glycosyltransferase family 4 protein [Bacteroidales bacterium]|nr:glycosyltransferase family 4 protein [Bacteroidales bacterium]MCM1414499.1 glycosyltransferase family 4 protein [bacterium]MCM1423761.1 glycosyltransferase family 4 protein [bacterium]